MLLTPVLTVFYTITRATVYYYLFSPLDDKALNKEQALTINNIRMEQ